MLNLRPVALACVLSRAGHLLRHQPTHRHRDGGEGGEGADGEHRLRDGTIHQEH